MKKFITLLFIGSLLMGFSNIAYGQENYGGVLNNFVKFGDNSSVSANYEFQVAPNITVSPEAIISFGDDSWIGLGARADYYFDSLFNLNEPWDIWAGVDSGFLLNNDHDTFTINLHTGVEYKFNDTWGLMAEFGGGKIASGGIGVGIHF